MESVIDLGMIEDVDVSARAYIRRRWGKKFYIIGGLLFVAGLPVALFFGGLSILPAVLWFAVGRMIAQTAARTEFMQQFAKKNGFSYELSGDIATVRGDLFERGYLKMMSHVVTGRYADVPVRFFFYFYRTGDNKHHRNHRFTVIETSFAGSVPEVIVDNKDDWYLDGGIGGRHRTLHTGTQFDDHFTLRVCEGLEIEALEVFTPEIMEGLIERGKDHSFEFVDNHLYVWKEGYVKKPADMQSLLTLTTYVIDALAPRLSRLHDDVDAVMATQKA